MCSPNKHQHMPYAQTPTHPHSLSSQHWCAAATTYVILSWCAEPKSACDSVSPSSSCWGCEREVSKFCLICCCICTMLVRTCSNVLRLCNANHLCMSLVLLLMPSAFLADPKTEAMTPLDLPLFGAAPAGGSWELPCPDTEGCARLGCCKQPCPGSSPLQPGLPKSV